LQASKSVVAKPSGPTGLFGIVLAAGQSTRFAGVKQLAEFRGQAMVARAMRVAEEVFEDRSVLVAGSEWPAVASAAGRLTGFLAINDAFQRGLGTSIAAGVGAVADCSSGVMLMLADQPLIDTSYLRRMIDTWLQDAQRIVASEYDGVVGPPVIFPARCFDDLRALDGDSGARKVIRSNASSLTTLNCANAGVDIDRKEDLDKLD
jgi:CTP:molybdopterin cytidylyltransferase MocA